MFPEEGGGVEAASLLLWRRWAHRDPLPVIPLFCLSGNRRVIQSRDFGATSTSPFAFKDDCLEIHRDSSLLTQFAVTEVQLPDDFGFPQY